MGRILVPPDKLMQVADQFLQGKQQMGHMCDQLNRQMMFVQGGWGKSRTGCAGKWHTY
nr:hypothetical protein [Paenibacillus terrae]